MDVATTVFRQCFQAADPFPPAEDLATSSMRISRASEHASAGAAVPVPSEAFKTFIASVKASATPLSSKSGLVAKHTRETKQGGHHSWPYGSLILSFWVRNFVELSVGINERALVPYLRLGSFAIHFTATAALWMRSSAFGTSGATDRRAQTSASHPVTPSDINSLATCAIDGMK